MKSIYKRLAPLAVATATLLATAPAHALSAYCFTDAWPAFIFSCTTLTVPANSDGGFIYYEVSSYVSYRVHDVVTGFDVASGDSGPLGARGLVFGLTNNYELNIQTIIAGWGYLNNT